MKEIEDLFTNYETEAFRLETLPIYRINGEWEMFQEYLHRNVIIQNEALLEYNDNAHKMINSGKRHIRARLIPNPITEYLIYETKVGYIPQLKLGFEFFFLEETMNIKKEVLDGIQDFWIFDKSTVLKMNYALDGSFDSTEIIKDKLLIEKYVKIRNYFVNNGKPLQNLLETIAEI